MTEALRVEHLASGPVTRQATGCLHVRTTGPGFTDVTASLAAFVAETGIRHGVATLLCRHTSASLAISENTDPDVRRDLATALDGMAPRHRRYRHDCEGPDDMPAHIRSVLTGCTLSIPVVDGVLALGTWQAVFLAEHRDRPHRREIVVNVTGD